ncbi:acetyltransferase-like isoleucine patch superfamily enzyme [Kribbella amoyensis]|uniref:Acetyltransferase-like isoleucine patch superfamily enzyme n=1 Tax=Kribbella amoyensis TaxID=996641 RepID=A0A561BK30_9ACTN|nr:acyltransferase [Kribbella amoyensis]TWD79226.1 acetyltransferase-like isoleucine patch superfamily enzyme [Kribbella amoyensis]
MAAEDAGQPVERLDFFPWEYARTGSEADRAYQAVRHRELAEHGKTELAGSAYVASTAAVFCDDLRMGERSYIAAHAYVTGEISLGSDTTVNPFAVVRGKITIGDGVRIGAHTSILAFNHGTAPDRPIFRQPTTAKGITVGDDVWIGSNVIVLDGVTVGEHSIIGAGAVVTKDVEPWSVVAGNPARKLRDRRAPSTKPSTDSETTAPAGAATIQVAMSGQAKAVPDLAERAAAFAAKAREQVDDVLARCFDGERFVDRPGIALTPAVRPWCDAVEIADLLVRRAPAGHRTEDLIGRLRARQDPATGLVAPGDLAFPEADLDFSELDLLQGEAAYHVLCVGYALQVLGSGFEHPIDTAHTNTRLDGLGWTKRAWGSGSSIDALGTALARNLVDHGELDETHVTNLFGWLHVRVDPKSGMWGRPHPDEGWLQVVNGFYRLTRGTYAQFGLPLPYPEQAIATTLTHAQDRARFSGDGYNSCNVLDVIHPLWLAGKQTDFGRAEGRRWAEEQLAAILGRWVDGAGFAFAPDGSDERSIPGLQGTEMWLSIIWLLTDYLGYSDAVGYRPRGVHRPEPLVTLPGLP